MAFHDEHVDYNVIFIVGLLVFRTVFITANRKLCSIQMKITMTRTYLIPIKKYCIPGVLSLYHTLGPEFS